MNKTSGTQEWCDKELNIYKGCPNNCEYCYAKRIGNHFGWKKKDDWINMEFNERAFNQRLYNWGVVMFPTSHDITTENVDTCIKFLLRLLKETNNKLLIVSKPNIECIKKLCKALENYQERILFRFTITSKWDSTAVKWEKEAPFISERIICLEYAYRKGWNTSVSVEPFLDKTPIWVIELIEKFCTETIWIGIMTGRKYKYHSIKNIASILSDLKLLPEDIRKKIRLKDSIVNFCKKNNIEVD
ncbi:MAG: hypothetical protein KJI71_01520 [Patescibacteria group bacterium]|nr:hypothetical protein [Patescibacteria group bacterium]